MFVVTGGGSGIGRALAHALAMRGKQVLIVGRRQQALEETASSFSSLITVCHADISSADGRTRLLSQLEDCEQIDGLVHNAGLIEPIMPIANIPEDGWRKILEVNVNAPLFLNQLLLNKLTFGRVLHISSGVAHFPVSGWAAYCVSKAALAMLTRCWQLESAQTAFAGVMPGIIDTNMQAMIRESHGMDPSQLKFYKTLQKENRLLKPETVALFLTWLLLDADRGEYVSQEWDIYDTSHHPSWLQAPHRVPHWDLL